MLPQALDYSRTAGEFFTIAELSARWRRKESTIRRWLSELYRSVHKPKPGQIVVHRQNAARRWLQIRGDYAALIRAIFIDRTIRL